jgi:hypothetical protein
MNNLNQQLFTARVSNLVKNLDDLGIEVPEVLRVERELHLAVQADERNEAGRIPRLEAQLRTAQTPDEYLRIKDELAGALLAQNNTRQASDSALASRAASALSESAYEIQESVSDRFNAVVDQYGLNEAATRLPDLTDPNLRTARIGSDAFDALNTWRQGAAALKPLWSIYTRIADHSGIELGHPIETGPNMDLAFVLGDITSLSQADRLVPAFAGWKAGSDGAARFGDLVPFVILPFNGVDLKLKPYAEAVELRTGATDSGESISVTWPVG